MFSFFLWEIFYHARCFPRFFFFLFKPLLIFLSIDICQKHQNILSPTFLDYIINICCQFKIWHSNHVHHQLFHPHGSRFLTPSTRLQPQTVSGRSSSYIQPINKKPSPFYLATQMPYKLRKTFFFFFSFSNGKLTSDIPCLKLFYL